MFKSKRFSMADAGLLTFIYLSLAIGCVIVIYPILFILSASFSDPYLVMIQQVSIIPRKLSLEAYRRVFAYSEIWRSYRNTIAYTLVGTTINVILTAMAAFPLSRRDFFGRRFFTLMLTVTMFISGGMIPSYLLILNLGLVNTFAVMVILGATSVWNIIIMRTFFTSNIPDSLQEAAIIDGASDLRIFGSLILPLSKPILSVMTLFYGVGHWNSFFTALIYLDDRKKYPLQLILREILLQNTFSQELSHGIGSDAEREFIGETIRYASIVVATVPILLVYPFIQKFFVKGVMIGAIKG